MGRVLMEKVFIFVGTKLAQGRLQMRTLVILALLLACVLHIVLQRSIQKDAETDVWVGRN